MTGWRAALVALALATGPAIGVCPAALGGMATNAAPGLPDGAEPDTAGDAEPDTSLGGFLRSLSDSTDRYFGLSAAQPDTTGFDSLLAYHTVHPLREKRGTRFSILPRFAFNRVDGPVWGGAVGVGDVTTLGRLGGELGYAAGPNDWLGGGDYRKTLRGERANWSVHLYGGRQTTNMERERPGLRLATLRALASGRDHKHYVRRDGFLIGLERQTPVWRAGVGYRDMLESPLATTTTWNFAHRDPAVFENLPAAFGRAREVELGAAMRLPFLPLTAEVIHHTSGERIGSDFEYRRTRIGLSGDFGLGQFATLVPQLAYGRLTGNPIPQESYYLGGSQSLRSVPASTRGGTGLALARLDVIGAHDLLELAHIPHPAAFPIQGGLFAGIGAVWGADPFGGPPAPGVDWPHDEAWMSEVGVALHYQPGLPDPDGFVRISFAWPLGPDRESTRWTVTYTRPLDLVRPFD